MCSLLGRVAMLLCPKDDNVCNYIHHSSKAPKNDTQISVDGSNINYHFACVFVVMVSRCCQMCISWDNLATVVDALD